MTDIREEVRARYAEAARKATAGVGCGCRDSGCCGSGCCTGGEAPSFGADLYDALDRADVPDAALLASLGCGNPTAVADLREGETVLDLGAGGGIDVLLSSRRVGPAGKVFGLDMTDDMLALARRNIEEAGAENIQLLRGYIEDIPLPAATVDVIISNCVINLSADKPAVFGEMHRVLRDGGRIGITDVVARDELSSAERAQRGSYVGCVAGALSFAEYTSGLADAGFEEIRLVPTHEVADGMYSAIVTAFKP
jgi:arsenite methyltransferase